MKTGHILATLPMDPATPKKGSTSVLSKTDSRYWLERVFKHTRANGQGIKVQDAEYSCRISRNGRRDRFQLDTPNKSAAAAQAAGIYRDIVGKGWDEALRLHKPDALPKETVRQAATIGSLIEAHRRLSSSRQISHHSYAKALRRLAAGVFDVEQGDKFDAFQGGNVAWKARIDQIHLAELTPAKVLAWKNEFLRQAANPEDRSHRAVTVNSMLRNARALFGRKVLPFLREELELPRPLFFEGLSAEKQPSLRYQSKVNAESILKDAIRELSVAEPEPFKLLLLTLVCGLRRSEADSLLWSQFDFQKRLLRMVDTEHHALKSADSAGEIDLDPEVCALLQKFAEGADGIFVLEAKRTRSRSEGKPRGNSYRCDATQQRLLEWLRSKGVPGSHPLHTMRKEIGSVIASRDGIWAASRYLRHSDIRITSAVYADKKVAVTAKLGAFTKPEPPEDQPEQESKPEGKIVHADFKQQVA